MLVLFEGNFFVCFVEVVNMSCAGGWTSSPNQFCGLSVHVQHPGRTTYVQPKTIIMFSNVIIVDITLEEILLSSSHLLYLWFGRHRRMGDIMVSVLSPNSILAEGFVLGQDTYYSFNLIKVKTKKKHSKEI